MLVERYVTLCVKVRTMDNGREREAVLDELDQLFWRQMTMDERDQAERRMRDARASDREGR